jgi:hypothetical protein
MLRTKLNLKLEVAGLMKAISNKRKRVLQKTGAYGRAVMQSKLRPKATAKKARTVNVGGVECFVPARGKVVDRKTGRPVSKELAMSARKALAAQLRVGGEGQAPRRGPKDTLRKNIIFVVDDDSVVIGARPFAQQPTLIGAASVPHLLDQGGIEVLPGSVRAEYEPRPFVGPTMDPTEKKFRELIESEPLR